MFKPSYTMMVILLCATGLIGVITAQNNQIEREPFGITPEKPIRPEQLDPLKFEPDFTVKFDMDGVTLEGNPPHYLDELKLTIHISNAEIRPQVENLQGDLQNFLATHISNKTYFDMKKLSEKLKLRETIILFLNENLTQAAIREVFITEYNVK